jgi:hypothetical protein
MFHLLVEDVFDERDVNRLQREDAYVERFFMHMYDLPGSQVSLFSRSILPSFAMKAIFPLAKPSLCLYVFDSLGDMTQRNDPTGVSHFIHGSQGK